VCLALLHVITRLPYVVRACSLLILVVVVVVEAGGRASW